MAATHHPRSRTTGHDTHARPRGGLNKWAPWAIAAVCAPIAMLIVTHMLRSDAAPSKSPDDLLTQARRELADQKPDRALDTVTLAELGSPPPATRQALADLRKQIETQ